MAALRTVVNRLAKPVAEHDREKLEAFCEALDVTPIGDVPPRSMARVAGEVKSVRIVPRAGAPAMEATISDGREQVVAVFLGRRKITGITPGRRIVLEGFVAPADGRLTTYNPVYCLLP